MFDHLSYNFDNSGKSDIEITFCKKLQSLEDVMNKFMFDKNKPCYKLKYIMNQYHLTTNLYHEPIIEAISCSSPLFRYYVCAEGFINENLHKYTKLTYQVHLKNFNFKYQTSFQCKHNSFFCKNSNKTCINLLYVCDGENDCLGGEDEQNCSYLNDFRCSNGKFIKIQFLCNFVNDCPDGIDELNCGIPIFFFKYLFKNNILN